jgi:hypothetical protein
MISQQSCYNTKGIVFEELECIFNKFPKYHMKILSGGSDVKIGREDISKHTIRNKCLYEISNDTGVRAANFTISKKFSCQKCKVSIK